MHRKTELRAHREELQRVQIGLVGLAGVLLVVTLANLVIETARQDNTAAKGVPTVEQLTAGPLGLNAASSGPPAGANEPLADLGVTPTAESAGQSVPDLTPDPRLREPMDRDPEQSGGAR